MNSESPTQLFGMKSSSHFPVVEQLVSDHKERWVAELARWYEADWQVALKGGEPPEAKHLLDLLNDSQRREASEVLSAIDEYYREEALHATEKKQNDATIDLPANQKQDLTYEFSVDEFKKSVASNEITLPHKSDPTARDVTIDHKPVIDESFDFSVGTKQVAKPQFESPQTKLPRIPGYKVKGVLGRGGMGVVYLAQQEGINRDVAIKMVLSGVHSSSHALARFQAEAQAVGKFQHENIVRIYDIGTHDGLPYFSLEYIDGKSLSEKIDGKPLDPVEAAKILEPLARGLEYAHQAGIIHRDLKPANILLTKDGVPKLSDFGLAKQFEEESDLSRTGDVVGTPSYMSPEQALGEKGIGPSADVYSLGAVLYCSLTGRPPFLAAKAADTLVQLLHDEPIPPIKLQPGLPKDLETICLKCLQKEPEKRYATAAEFADDLKRFVNGEPISARPVSRTERVVRWSRRNPRQAVLIATAAGLASILAVGGPLAAATIYKEKQSVVAAKKESDNNAKIAMAARAEAEKQATIADQNAKQAEANEAIAEKNAEAAMVQQKNAVDALKSLVFEVQRNMSDKPSLIKLRTDLLDVASEGLQRIEQAGGDVKAQNIIAASIDRRLGDINFELGRVKQARANYQQCLDILLELQSKNQLPGVRHNLSTAYELLGVTSRELGELTVANDFFLKSLEQRRLWVEEVKDDPHVEQNLATILGKLGMLAQDQGRLDEATKYFVESYELRNKFLELNPNSGAAKMEVLGSRWSLATLGFQKLDTEAAIAEMQEVVARIKTRAEQNPYDVILQQNAVLAAKDIGVMLAFLNRSSEALEYIKPAIDHMVSIKTDVGESLRYQDRLADCYYVLGLAQNAEGKADLAEEAFRKCLELRMALLGIEPDNLSYVASSVLTAARLDQLDLFNEQLSSLKIADSDAGVKFVFASSYAQVAESLKRKPDQLTKLTSDQAKRLAVELLQQANANGFYRAADLKYSPDLEPVRNDAISLLDASNKIVE